MISAADSDPKLDRALHPLWVVYLSRDPCIPVSIGSRQLLHECGIIIKRGQLLESWAFARLPLWRIRVDKYYTYVEDVVTRRECYRPCTLEDDSLKSHPTGS